MKQKIILISLIALMVISVGLLSGCADNTNYKNNDIPLQNKFIGTWKTNSSDDIVILYGRTTTFFSDGTHNMKYLSGSWEIKDNKLLFEIHGVNTISLVYNYVFSNNATTLTLSDVSDGSIIIYTKQ